MKKIFAILAILIVFSSFAFADENMPRVTVPTTAQGGFGGPHIAYTDNVYSLLVNPAAMIRVNERTFFNLNPSLVNPQSTFTLIDSLLNISPDKIDDLVDVLSKGNIGIGLELKEFPLSFGWVANGFGFALFNNTFLNVSILGTEVFATVYEDIMLPIGFGFKILETPSHSIDAGLTLKPFARLYAKERLGLLKAVSSIVNGDMGDLIDGINTPLMTGASLDIGLLYRWDIGFSAGMTFNDIYSRGTVIRNFTNEDNESGTFVVPFTWNLGVAYEFRPGNFWPGLPAILSRSGLTFAFDWRDFGNAQKLDDYLQRNPALDIGMGIQLSLIDTFIFRVGMNECLPAVGLGFDLGAFKLDIAYYGKELGNEPGQNSVAVLELSMAVRPGAKERDWPWARKSLLSAFGIGQ